MLIRARLAIKDVFCKKHSFSVMYKTVIQLFNPLSQLKHQRCIDNWQFVCVKFAVFVNCTFKVMCIVQLQVRCGVHRVQCTPVHLYIDSAVQYSVAR